MSYLAIGAATRALAELLGRKLNKPPLMGGAVNFRVTVLPPDDDRVSTESGINLFLYRVAESPYLKNMDWRGDRKNPVNGRRPPLALNLSYILTAYAQRTGDSAQDDITAHQLLGNAMAILNENPVLNDVHDSDFDADLDNQFAPELRDSFEDLKVTLVPFSLEELSKIWTGFNKAYRLSVAYDVTLVQIGPTAPVPSPPPAVQAPALRLDTLPTPLVASVDPPTGAAGAAVTLRGQGFTGPGETTVTVGDVASSASDLTRLAPNEIALNIPEAIQRGPRVPIVVSVAGRSSPPAFYEVRPWLATHQPLRGITGIPLTIPFAVPPGATVSMEIDGIAAATTVDPSAKTVRAVVPLAIATNGPKSVVLVVNDGTPHRSNARTFEVLPLLNSVTITTTAAPLRTTITLNGERLAADAAVVVAGGLSIRAGANANAGQLVAQVDRALAANLPVFAVIDGRQTNTLPSTLDRIDPPSGFPGDVVVLNGQGLSGRSVSVAFGASAVAIGPQPSAGRFAVAVPATLPAVAVQVTVTIDGRSTNPLPFTVSG